MFVLLKLDTYSQCDCGYESVEDVFGPFATREEADALEKRLSKENLVGQSYRVKPILPIQQEIDWRNQLGYGEKV